MALYLITVISFISIFNIPSSSSQTTLQLTLTPIPNPHISPSNQFIQNLNHLASSSLSRANHLKNPQNISSSTPLFPQSYGAYSVSLNFGSPSQTLSFVMDTGSSLVWFPCTKRYTCEGCDFGTGNQTSIPKFIPKESKTAKILGCGNKKCGLISGSNNPYPGQCDGKQICPAYILQYGSGSTSGLLLSETLNFPEGDVTDFIVGCSIISIRQPSGIAGFGRSPASLPAQMGLKKFSYCLVSHKFDNTPVSSKLVLVRNNSVLNEDEFAGVTYTKFRENPVNSSSVFKEYYYLSLRKLTVGGKLVKIPYGYLTPRADGNGGTIIDSGTTFTYMDGHVHNLVAKEFETQMSKYTRAFDLEKMSGLRPCFNVSGKPETLMLPELVFHFKGGGKLSLPPADYFSILGDFGVVCMTLVSSEKIGSGQVFGPSIIIGNYQQQNVYLEYDLENGRLGFKKQICN